MPTILRKAFHNTLFCVALAVLPLSLQAQAPAIETLPQEAFDVSLDTTLGVAPPVVTGEFANGLRYYILENREPENRAELRLVVNVGSILESEDQLGLAHFLEHMAFNGTEHFAKQELIEFMESIGMRMGPGVNASTSFDETIYQLQLPTDNPAHLDTAFQIMEDWATGMSLESDEIDLERGVVIEEWRQGQGAQSRIRDQQLPVLLKDSRYAERLPIGTLESLQNFDHEALRRFYREWYRPELMAVVAVGDFEAEQIEALVRQYFEPIPTATASMDRPQFEVPAHEDTAYTIVTDPEVPLTQIALYHKQPLVHDWTVGGYRQRLVERLYNVMLNTRFQEITRQPDPPFLAASSSNSSLVRPIEAWVLGAAVQEGGLEQGLAGLLAESERIARFGFTDTELERQKTAMLRAMELAYNNRESRSSGSHAGELIRAYLSGESVPGAAWEYALGRRFVPGIGLEEVNAVGRQWNRTDNRVVAVTAPEKAGVVVPTATQLASILDGAASSVVTAYEDKVSDEDLVSAIPQGSPVVSMRTLEGEITEWQLGNGIRVLLKPTDFRAEEVLFAATRKGGTSLASDADFIPASTAVAVIANGGVGNFNAIDLQRKLTGKVANVAPIISDYEEGLRGNASPADLETLMQMIYLRLTAPRADPDFYQVFLNQMTAVLQNRSTTPANQFEDTFQRLMFQDHPRRQPPTVALLDATDLDKSMAFYEERLGDASGFTFVFVGNFDPATLQPLVETYIGGLPASGRETAWVDQGIRNPTGVLRETVRAGQEPQARTRIVFNGRFDVLDSHQRLRLVAVSRLLQTRLRNIIREQLGGSYGVQVAPQMHWEPVQGFNLLVEFGSDPARAEELAGIVFDEVEKLKTDAPTAAEFEEIRQNFLRSYETSLEQNNFWLSQLSQALSMGMTDSPASAILDQPNVVAALDPDSIRDAARRLLDTGNHIHLTLLPENQGASE